MKSVMQFIKKIKVVVADRQTAAETRSILWTVGGYTHILVI